MTGIDRVSIFQQEDLIRDVGTSRWINIMGYSRGAILFGGSGVYELTFAVRGLPGMDPENSGYTPHILMDGEGNVVGLQINGGEAKELPPQIFLFHSFRVDFEPAATTGNPVGLVLSA